jgi:hypothetical protein
VKAALEGHSHWETTFEIKIRDPILFDTRGTSSPTASPTVP